MFSKNFWTPNIDGKGRVARGLVSCIAFAAAYRLREVPWAALLLGVSGAFTLFEALRGWCVARACGLKTPM